MAALLLSTVAAGIFLHLSDGKRIKELESQMSQMRKQDRKSVMDRRVSKQMEEIAYGQQLLSEERSQEAIRQSEIAQAATLRSEAERQKAVQAQVRAEASALEAKQSYEMAEQQRMEANEQRQQAVSAKLTADTLNYISLGRTLGLQSYTIYRTGDTEIGNMLAYTAYRFTHDYGGDIYVPAVFQSMMQSAGARQSWSVHDGRITGTDFFPNGKSLLTVSTLGEMFLNEIRNGQLTTRRLFANKAFSFRDAFASRSGKSYAVSQTGHLVIAGTGQPEVIRLERLTRPFRLEIMGNGKELLIIGEHNVALLDLTTDKITTTRQLDFNVVCGTRRNNRRTRKREGDLLCKQRQWDGGLRYRRRHHLSHRQTGAHPQTGGTSLAGDEAQILRTTALLLRQRQETALVDDGREPYQTHHAAADQQLAD